VLVEFLTDEQAEAYGRFVEEQTRPELERFFYLDDVDRDLTALRRTPHQQLGFAVQMCTVRYVGRFLVDDPLDVPWPVVEHLTGRAVGVEDPSVVKRYAERRQTRVLASPPQASVSPASCASVRQPVQLVRQGLGDGTDAAV
jgi:hypothetical protein